MTIKILRFAASLVISAAAFGQQSPQQATAPQGLADLARRERAKAESGVPDESNNPQGSNSGGQQRSVAEVAAERRAKAQAEVRVTANQVKELFTEIDKILDFASQDSGLPRRSAVKHEVVSQEDVRNYMSAALAGSVETQHLARAQVVLKKFGYLPPTFDLKSYLIKATSQSIAGYYDEHTKTMHLLSWVGIEQQRPIMAHELTHALQDQNYDLARWAHQATRPPAMRVQREEAQESIARKAVVEGQAMLVFLDYLLKPYGHSLADTPSAIDFVKDRMTETYESALVIHNAPLLMKDTAMFPYREGLLFELELLKKGGINLAFAGAFSRPPANAHEILEPNAYLEHERVAAVVLPDLSGVLADDYEVYDSGSIGQLDVRILSQQLGSENDMFTVTPNWQGGAYVAVKRKSSASIPEGSVSTADIALLYVSRWKTAEAAERFMDVYRKSLARRTTVFQEDHRASSGSVRVDTSEGQVFLELLPNNTVFISHGFPEAVATGLRQIVRNRPADDPKSASAGDLTLRLFEIPAFRVFQQQLFKELLGSVGADGIQQ